MSKTRFECRQVIKKNWTQMTPGSETLTYKFNISQKYYQKMPVSSEKNYVVLRWLFANSVLGILRVHPVTGRNSTPRVGPTRRFK